MKNVVLGIIGTVISIYVLLTGLNVYTFQTFQNQLENSFSRILKETLEDGYASGDSEAAIESMQQSLTKAMSDKGEVFLQIQSFDVEKGILSASVTGKVEPLIGEIKTIVLEKTVIIDKKMLNEPRVMVQFYVDQRLYKTFQLVKGEECPLPKPPFENFVGWAESGNESEGIISKIGQVWEDKVYLAITE